MASRRTARSIRRASGPRPATIRRPGPSWSRRWPATRHHTTSGDATVILDGKRVLITGGTGSLGSTLVHRLLSGEMGRLARLTVFSRDEAKQHDLRLKYQHQRAATDDVIYRSARDLLRFRIGDVRDFASIRAAVREADVIFHAAALKQVPTCEYFPVEAVQT